MDSGVLVLNSGSSSLKFALYREDGSSLDVVCRGDVTNMMTEPQFAVKDGKGKTLASHAWGKGEPLSAENALRHVLDWIETNAKTVRIAAAGHRLVQGGTRYDGPCLVDDEALAYLDGLSMLEPQHQPAEVAGIKALAKIYPKLPQVAAFDTSFHRTMPENASIYAVPDAVQDAGVRHWGYHGISYDYINTTLPDFDREAKRVIVAHLGSGASMCAILEGRSIATTMGFSAIDGLPMGTRCGAIDPGALLYLLRCKLFDAGSLQKMLYEESGLKGLSGISNNVQVLLKSEDPRAKRALDYFIYRIVYFAGAHTALLGGLDAIVFTAGIGEHAAAIRAGVCEQLGWLGLDLDKDANEQNGPRISTAESRVRAWVIPTNEEIMIARHTMRLAGAKAAAQKADAD